MTKHAKQHAAANHHRLQKPLQPTTLHKPGLGGSSAANTAPGRTTRTMQRPQPGVPSSPNRHHAGRGTPQHLPRGPALPNSSAKPGRPEAAAPDPPTAAPSRRPTTTRVRPAPRVAQDSQRRRIPPTACSPPDPGTKPASTANRHAATTPLRGGGEDDAAAVWGRRPNAQRHRAAEEARRPDPPQRAAPRGTPSRPGPSSAHDRARRGPPPPAAAQALPGGDARRQQGGRGLSGGGRRRARFRPSRPLLESDGRLIVTVAAMKKNKGEANKETECFYCKQKGHWNRNCKKYLADKKNGSFGLLKARKLRRTGNLKGTTI
nr:translation initiation factor IF-2-like [Aegilops tauschii subsp. strangulata]